ncbi:phage tail tape measure protein [Enterococcus sp.]|uniref:phage tail tape measure protein n=1 Tax=Enterococcus sp. TaxID=35783 RepID=UPI003C75B6FA
MAGGTPLGNMRIKLELDDAQFGKGVANSKKQIQYLTKEMQANMKIADMAGDTQGKLGTKFESLSKIIEVQEKQVAGLKQSYKDSFVNGEATESTTRLAGELQNANGKLASYRKQLIDTAGAMAEWQVKNEGLTGSIYRNSEKLIKVGDQMSNLGGKLTTGLTVPIAGAAIAAGKAAIDWESSFAGVKKTNDEVVDSNGNVVYSYEDLEEGLRDLAKELPSTHDEIASVAEAAGQLGIETENVTAFTQTMIDLGEATNLTAETAATELARFANIVGLSQDQFDNLGSSLVFLGNNYATTEAEISSMALRLAAAGEQVGMSEGDILGFAAALSSVGVESQAGGTAFSKVMVQMQLATEKGVGAFDDLKEQAADSGVAWEDLESAVQNGGKELKAVAGKMEMTSSGLKKMYKHADKNKTSLESFSDVAGMTGDQFAKMFASDPTGAIMKFVEGLANAEKTGSSAIKILDDMDIKEVRLRDSLLRAANASDIFSDAVDDGNKAFEENTALAEEAGKRYETTESKLKMLKNEVVDMAIDMGGPLVDALRDGVEAGKPLIKMLSDAAKAFSDADPKTQQMIMKLIAYTAAAGPVLSITGKITSSIGGFGKTFVDVAGAISKKKAIVDITKQMTDGAGAAGELSKVMASGADDVLKFGGAATSAAGSNGVGAMLTALGTGGGLASALPIIIGAGGLLAVGYGAWKLFGEEAWNSSQRVKDWGVDVGETTAATLEVIKDNTLEASGQFGLLAEGFNSNTDIMAGNFATIGETIEASLIKKIEGLDELIKNLPASVDQATREMLEQENQEAQKALEVIQQNNDRIAEIRQDASQNNRELSAAEAKIISDLAKNTTEEYVKTLDLSAEEKKKVLAAMTGDVSQATEEEARLWVQSLGKQRQAAADHAAKSRKEQEEYLKELGYNLEGEFAQKYLAAWDEVNKTTLDGFDGQIAALAKKYPELMNEVHFASGQLISEAKGAENMLVESNKTIMDSHQAMTDKVSNNSLKNAEMLKWSADEGSESMKLAAQTWNETVFDTKTGEVKTNAKEAVIEATKDSETWNNMRLVLHNADLDSNAKVIIGEAAIANGWWDGMAWEDKEAVLGNGFQKTMYEALTENGTWNKLNFEQKTAILNSNTPEKMAETLYELGLWEEFNPEIKELNARNEKFLAKMHKSEISLKDYNKLSPELKTLLAKNPGLMEINDTKKALDDYNKLPPKVKELLGDSFDVNSKLDIATQKLMDYDKYTPGNKEIRVEAETTAIDYVQQEMDKIQDKYVTIKVNTLMEEYQDSWYARGTNYHPGGGMVVNDQSGPLYEELVQYPNGFSFIAKGRNVYIPDAPVGAKVYTASMTERMVPRYADGVGVPENSSIVRNLRLAAIPQQTGGFGNGEMINMLKAIYDRLMAIDPNFKFNVHNSWDIDGIRTEINTENAVEASLQKF